MLSVRRGFANVKRKIERGEAIHIVAFGSSITHDGYYLEALVSNLSSAFRPATFRLTRIGLRGAMSTYAAHHVEDRVLPEAPDLVLLEFSINDDLIADEIAATVQAAALAIMRRIRARFPACDFGFVYFTYPGVATASTSVAIPAYERLAEAHGIPSIHLAALMERLVETGQASRDEGPFALFSDGVHHAPITAQLVGGPFSDALVEAIGAKAVPLVPFPSAFNDFDQARRLTIGALADVAPGWSFGPPSDDLTHLAHSAVFVDGLAVAGAPGASFSFRFYGTGVVLWVLSVGGRIAIDLNGVRQIFAIAADRPWRFLDVRTGPVPEDTYTVSVTALDAPAILGDFFFYGIRIP